jgi:hypothetical protein
MFWFQWKIKKNKKKIQVQQGSMSASSPVRSLSVLAVLRVNSAMNAKALESYCVSECFEDEAMRV